MAVRPVELEILLAYGADRWKKNARGATAAEELAVRLVSALHAKEGANDVFAKSSSSSNGKRMSAGSIMKEVTLGKKKARQKAKKLAAATAAAQKNEEEKKTDATTTKPMYINKTTRKEAGKGRGKGMFAKVAIAAGEVIVRSRPALSTVFDPFAQSICSFCFKPASAAGTVKVDLHLNKRDGKVGIFFDEKKIRGAIRCVINGVAKGGVEASPNALSGVMPGDVVETIAGHQLAAGKGALSRCLELLKSAGAAAATKECMFPITVRRVALQPCLTCSRAAICMDCDRAGCGAWHSLYECPAFVQLPEAVKKGESSPIRMMLRYKSIATAGEWTGVIDGGDGGRFILS